MSVIYSGDGITFGDGSTLASGFTGTKNRLINGAMEIDQRGFGAVSTSGQGSAGLYSIDRWGHQDASDGDFSMQQDTDVPTGQGFRNSLLFTVTAAKSSTSNYSSFFQSIEGNMVADLMWGTAYAKTVTVSFWVKSSVSGTFGGCLRSYNGSSLKSYPYTYVVNATNTWEYKTITIPGETSMVPQTNNNLALTLFFTPGIASNSAYAGTAFQWNAANCHGPTTASTNIMSTLGATFKVTGVQLESGSVATTFDRRPYPTELMLCQRYFERVYCHCGIRNGSFGGWSHEQTEVDIPFKVLKRGTPSVTYINYGSNISGTPWVTRDFQPGTTFGSHKINSRYFALNEYIYLDDARGSLLVDAEI